MQIKDSTRIVEIIAVLITGFGKFLFMDYLDLKLPFILSACLFWFFYIIYRKKQDNKILEYWGLSKTNFKKTFQELLPYLVFIIGSFVLIGHFTDRSVLNISIFPILIIYPLWGIIQQFIIVGLLAKNLKDYQGYKIPELAIILVTAIIFGVVHHPFYLLMAGTFLLALVYTFLFLRNRNLLVLGIFHGWLGAFFYYCILSRDTFSEVFKLF